MVRKKRSCSDYCIFSGGGFGSGRRVLKEKPFSYSLLSSPESALRIATEGEAGCVTGFCQKNQSFFWSEKELSIGI